MFTVRSTREVVGEAGRREESVDGARHPELELWHGRAAAALFLRRAQGSKAAEHPTHTTERMLRLHWRNFGTRLNTIQALSSSGYTLKGGSFFTHSFQDKEHRYTEFISDTKRETRRTPSLVCARGRRT